MDDIEFDEFSSAREESQGVSFSLCCRAKSCDIKLPAAPESIRAVLVIILSRINNLTGNFMLDGEVVQWELTLTERELDTGLAGQEILMCPA